MRLDRVYVKQHRQGKNQTYPMMTSRTALQEASRLAALKNVQRARRERQVEWAPLAARPAQRAPLADTRFQTARPVKRPSVVTASPELRPWEAMLLPVPRASTVSTAPPLDHRHASPAHRARTRTKTIPLATSALLARFQAWLRVR